MPEADLAAAALGCSRTRELEAGLRLGLGRGESRLKLDYWKVLSEWRWRFEVEGVSC